MPQTLSRKRLEYELRRDAGLNQAIADVTAALNEAMKDHCPDTDSAKREDFRREIIEDL